MSARSCKTWNKTSELSEECINCVVEVLSLSNIISISSDFYRIRRYTGRNRLRFTSRCRRVENVDNDKDFPRNQRWYIDNCAAASSAWKRLEIQVEWIEKWLTAISGIWCGTASFVFSSANCTGHCRSRHKASPRVELVISLRVFLSLLS